VYRSFEVVGVDVSDGGFEIVAKVFPIGFRYDFFKATDDGLHRHVLLLTAADCGIAKVLDQEGIEILHDHVLTDKNRDGNAFPQGVVKLAEFFL
jgi:hypothetical protein